MGIKGGGVTLVALQVDSGEGSLLGHGESGCVLRGACFGKKAAIKVFTDIRQPMAAALGEAAMYQVRGAGWWLLAVALAVGGTPSPCGGAGGGCFGVTAAWGVAYGAANQ